MDDNRNSIECEYDSDDMSAGARLMRYYVSDEPRPDSLVQTGKSADLPPSSPPSSPPSPTQDVSTQLEAANGTKDVTSDADGNEHDDRHNGNENEDEDVDVDAEFRRDLEELRGDVLYDIAGRYSHREILDKIEKFHPHAQFASKDLTWRLANSIKSRSRRQGITRPQIRAALDATRIANGVEPPKNYRPRSGGRHEEVGGKLDASSEGNGEALEGNTILVSSDL